MGEDFLRARALQSWLEFESVNGRCSRSRLLRKRCVGVRKRKEKKSVVGSLNSSLRGCLITAGEVKKRKVRRTSILNVLGGETRN